jgi:hypothetical protein
MKKAILEWLDFNIISRYDDMNSISSEIYTLKRNIKKIFTSNNTLEADIKNVEYRLDLIEFQINNPKPKIGVPYKKGIIINAELKNRTEFPFVAPRWDVTTLNQGTGKITIYKDFKG